MQKVFPLSPGAAGTGPKSTPRKNPRDFLLARGGGSADPGVTLSPETLTVDQLQAPGIQKMENQLGKQEKMKKKRVVTAAEGAEKGSRSAYSPLNPQTGKEKLLKSGLAQT